MFDVLQSKKVIVYAKKLVTDEYKPFGCAQAASLRVNTEILDTTTVGSGFWKSVKPRLSDWAISLSGVTLLRDLATSRFFALDMVTQQVRLSGLYIQIIFTDEGGYSRNFTGFVYIPTSEITKANGQLSKFSIEFTGSEAFTLDDPYTPPALTGDILSDYWTTTPGGFTISGTSVIHGYNLTGKIAIEVKREGIEHDLVTAAPVGRQARFTTGTGVVDFDTTIPFNSGERVFVIFKS